MEIAKKKILIVEDEAVAAENLKEFLEEKGFAIAGICANGEDAVKTAIKTPPDLIFMDIKLEGEMDGVEVSKRIVNHIYVPIIYLTAYCDEKTLARAELTGPFGYINKPYEMEEVLIAIRIALHKHQLEMLEWQVKEAAEKASRAKSQFLSYTSHEIRSPLTVIIGYADLLSQSTPTSTQTRAIDKIKHSAEQVLCFVNDILDYSKIIEGKLNLEKETFALKEKIAGIIDTYSLMFSKKGLQLHYTIAPDVPEHVVGDAFRIEQILANLLGNSAKFTKSGSCSVEVQNKNNNAVKDAETDETVTLIFSVKDTGIGIVKEKQNTIFDSYEQSYETSGKIKGTGLGLAITRKLVEMMEGQITVESSPGKGSVFSFTLALDRVER